MIEADLPAIIALSLKVSLIATTIAALIGLPLGTILAIYRFPTRTLLILSANALLGLPPVVVGLFLYLLLSRSGPLGSLGLLFTPTAMIAAQAILALPIVTALTHRAMERVWAGYGTAFRSCGAGRLRTIPHLLAIGRAQILTAILAGFGRTISEVGAILIVGGNIAGATRTMTTTIALQTGQGAFATALALGAILIGISVAVSATAFLLVRSRAAAAILALTLLAGPAFAQSSITLASTTSVDNSGLLPHILPAFTQATGIKVKVLALGTGQALAVAARGDADLLLVHDPEAEAAFMAAGHGSARRFIAWNDFIIVGPTADPARIAGGTDAVAALRAIYAARAPFISRGDNSGTNALEKRLWKQAGLNPAHAEGAWYKDIGGGMGAALSAAAAIPAYTLSDRGTWIAFHHRQDLRIVIEGSPALLNRYSVIELNPEGRNPAAMADAAKLADWLAGPAGQARIAAYTMDGQTLFHPASDPLPE